MSSHIGSLSQKSRVILSNGSPATRYGVAVVAALGALSVRLMLFPVLGEYSPYLPFALAVMIAALLGGRRPGFVATALSALGVKWFFLEPTHSLAIANPAAAAGLALFVTVGFLISVWIGDLGESLTSAARAEEALRRKTQLVDLSHDAVITADSNRRVTGWNVGAAEMYGWAESEVLGKTIHEFLHIGSGISTAEIDEILHREGHWDGELNHTARDGRRLVVESRQVLLRDDRNQPAGILEINRDVTERKRAEEALLRASEQRRLVLEAANMGAWDMRLDSGEVFWDERCRKMFGVDDPHIGYPDAIARIHADDRSATDEAVKMALAGIDDGAYYREFRVVWPDGSVHWVASQGQVLFEGGGDRRRAVRFVGANMEITERRNAEERSRQSQKLESIGLLAGGVAHDFNNILTVIMGSASTALLECPSCEYSQAILAASQRAGYLTKQLLAYAGKGQVFVKIVDLTELVLQSRELLAASVPKRVSLGFNLSKELRCIEIDASQMEQILMNLVINAGEAIPPKSDGLIEIATSGCEVAPDMARRRSKAYDVAPGAYVCLEVRDNGAGMDEATVARIFDPFFSTKFTGRGLGLAAVHGIVHAAKGFIDVRSSPGAGATFQVFLPASGKTRSTEKAPDAPRQQHRGSSTILVVDDEEMVRRLACTTLRRHGYEVLEASDGKDALRVLAEASSLPSLVLLDLAMPVMGGDELAPILERTYPGLKIVITSGYPEEDARKGLPFGSVVDFLQKPFTVAALAEKIGEALVEESAH